MGKIFCVIGKSSSGKDTIYQKLIEQREIELIRMIPYTTRPIRSSEQEGREYHFVSVEALERLEREHKVIERRDYHTIHGMWSYFTVDDGKMDVTCHNYIMIATLEAYENMKAYFGEDVMCPIYIEVEDGERLQRALARERQQQQPRYAELCRRFLADCEDFSEEKLSGARIVRRFENKDIQSTYRQIMDYIKGEVVSGD